MWRAEYLINTLYRGLNDLHIDIKNHIIQQQKAKILQIYYVCSFPTRRYKYYDVGISIKFKLGYLSDMRNIEILKYTYALSRDSNDIEFISEKSAENICEKIQKFHDPVAIEKGKDSITIQCRFKAVDQIYEYLQKIIKYCEDAHSKTFHYEIVTEHDNVIKETLEKLTNTSKLDIFGDDEDSRDAYDAAKFEFYRDYKVRNLVVALFAPNNILLTHKEAYESRK